MTKMKKTNPKTMINITIKDTTTHKTMEITLIYRTVPKTIINVTMIDTTTQKKLRWKT